MRSALLLVCLAACSPQPTTPTPTPRAAAVHESIVTAARTRYPLTVLPNQAEALREDLLEQVLGALAERDERIRALARRDAQSFQSAEVAALRTILNDPQAADARRAAAAEALGSAPGAAAELALLDFLPDLKTPSWLRAQCIYHWGQRQPSPLLTRAVLRLKYEPDDECVIWLADALFRHGSRAGLDGLRVLVTRAQREELRALASERLALIEADPRAERETADASELAELWTWIEKLAHWDLRQVDDARFVLQRLPDYVVPLLADCLRDENVYIRVHAAQTLERRGPRAIGARAALVAALADRSVAPTAASALGALGEPALRPILEACLADSRDLDLAVAAARALGQLGDPAALPALAAIRGPEELLLVAAIARLDLGKDPALARQVLAGLENPAADREAAAAALGRWMRGRSRFSAWEALLPAAGHIETSAEAATRRAAQAQLVRAELGP